MLEQVLLTLEDIQITSCQKNKILELLQVRKLVPLMTFIFTYLYLQHLTDGI